jgi:hypothetical protein
MCLNEKYFYCKIQYLSFHKRELKNKEVKSEELKQQRSKECSTFGTTERPGVDFIKQFTPYA